MLKDKQSMQHGAISMTKKELLELIKDYPDDAFDYMADRVQFLKEDNCIRISSYSYVDGN